MPQLSEHERHFHPPPPPSHAFRVQTRFPVLLFIVSRAVSPAHTSIQKLTTLFITIIVSMTMTLLL